MSHQKILDEVAKTSIQLMLNEPFFGHFFTSILKDVSEKTDSIAVTVGGKQMIKLLVNPKYWENELTVTDLPTPKANKQATQDLRYGAIKHQILHIVFKHTLRYPEFGNKKLFSIASDLAANQYIKSEQLTEDAIRLEDFPEFKLNRGQAIDYYYKKLSDELDEMQQQEMGGGSSDDNQDGEDENEEGGNDGNGLNEAQQKLKDLLEDEDNKMLNQHKFWDEFERLSSAEQKMVEAMINESIVNSVSRLKPSSYGNLPAGLQQYINLLVDSLKPNVNWRRVLRIFTASSSRTRLKNTIRRPSKRYGTSPGIKIQSKQKILVAIDTSGSVQEDELKEFFGELYHIWKQGAEIYVVECDTQIHNQYPYTGNPPEVISGRGGTDFNAPIIFANESYMPDAIVYFTDGHAAEPQVVSRKPILWMVTSEGVAEDAWDYLPGRKVKMTKQI